MLPRFGNFGRAIIDTHVGTHSNEGAMWELTRKLQDHKSYELSFLNTIKVFLKYVNVLNSGIAGRNEFASDCSVQQAISIFLYGFMKKHGFATVVVLFYSHDSS